MFDVNWATSIVAPAFDVAVIGAGPAGAATSLRLAQHGCRVLLVERSAFAAPRVGESLAPSVQPLLTDLGVWDRFLALGPLPSWGTRSLWGDSAPQEHAHLMSPYGCGWHIDRLRFDRMLAEAAVDAGATLCTETRLTACVDDGGTWRLLLADAAQAGCADDRFTARVIIDATGRGARVAQQLNARRCVFDTLIGVTTLFGNVPDDAQGYTLVETAADGWWYSAPIGGGRLVTMLMTDGDLAGRARLATSENWRVRLQATDATAARVGDATTLWGPRAFSALSQRLCRAGASRWLAVGDAALAVDPVSGSGVLRALRTARAGAATALELLQHDALAPIDAYEAERDRECLAYLEERTLYYGVEQRWRDEVFWQRRIPQVQPSITSQ
jgi:flavin-dependent dehydrogenase